MCRVPIELPGAKVPLFVTSPTIMPLPPSVPLVSTKTSLLLVPLMRVCRR